MNFLKNSLLCAVLLSTVAHAAENDKATQGRSEQLKKIVPPEDFKRYVPTLQEQPKYAELYEILVVDHKVDYREAFRIAEKMVDIKPHVPEQNFLYSDKNLQALIANTYEWELVRHVFVELSKEKMGFESSAKITLKLLEVSDANPQIEPRTFLKFDNLYVRNMAFNADALNVLDKYATFSKEGKLLPETAAFKALGVIKSS